MAAPVTKMENKLSADWRQYQKEGGLDSMMLVLSLLFFLFVCVVLACMWSHTGGGAHIPTVKY